MQSPDVWGPRFWYDIHTVGFTFPQNPRPDQQEGAKKYFESLQYILPCDTCKSEYSKLLQQNPLDAAVLSGRSLAEWTVRIHNAVNRRLGKPEMSFAEAQAIWTNPANPIHQSATLTPLTGSLKNLPRSAFKPPEHMSEEERRKGWQAWQWILLVIGIIVLITFVVLLSRRFIKNGKEQQSSSPQPPQSSSLPSLSDVGPIYL